MFPDREVPATWRVEYFDNDGGCYVTLFMGPAAERRARDYAVMLVSGSRRLYEPSPAAALVRRENRQSASRGRPQFLQAGKVDERWIEGWSLTVCRECE